MAVSIHPVTWLHADIHAGAGADAARAAAERLLSALLARHASELRAASESVLEAEFVGPIAAVECARRMQTVVARLNEARGTVAAVGLAVGVDVGAAEAGQARARRIAASARDGEILVSAAARSFLDPYLWGLCTPPTRGTTGPGEPARPLDSGANRVEWNPATPTRGQVEKQEAAFLDILMEQQSLKISLHEGDEIAGTLTYYARLPLDSERLSHLVAAFQQTFRTANAVGGGNGETLEQLRRHGTELYDLLFNSEFKERLGRLTVDYLVLNLNERAVGVPWELLYDGRDFLCRRFAVGRVVRTAERPLGKPRPAPICASMLVLSNPRGDLASASQEGLVVRNEFLHSPRMEVHWLNGAVERREAVEVLREHDILHYCGHARYVEGKPEETGWLLADGMLSVADITGRLAGGEKRFPGLVFSNACQSGVTGAWEPAKTADGLAQAFLLAGVQHYVGTFWDVLDAPSGDMAVLFYRRLASGQSVGKALLSARERLAADRGEAHLIWAAYVLYGDPRRIFFGAAEAPADRMLYGEESAETATAGASPALTRSAAPIVHRAAAPTWLVGVGLAALVLAAIPAGLWLNRTLYPTGTPHPFEYKGVAPIAVTSEYVEGLELYRLGDYDGAWAIFMRQAATRPADPVLAGLVRAARNRSLAGAEEQRTARIDVLLADLAELMKAPPVPPSDLDDWSSPVLTAVLDALEAAPENTAGGMDIAVMEYLEEALLAHPRLSVLERRHLDRLLNEIRLNKLGLSDPAEAERTARLKLVRLWFFPSLTVEGGKSVLSLSAVWENSETLFILRQELSSDPRETAAGMMAQLSPKLREALPIRGLLLEQTPDGWWCNVGGDHGVTPETRFRPVGAAGVTLSVRAVEPRRALLDAGGASLLVGARIQQID